MKVYGKEYDYYDCVMSYGQDPLCVWHRKFEELQLSEAQKEFPLDILDFSYSGKGLMQNLSFGVNTYDTNYIQTWYWFHTGYVFFCGKVYPFIKCSHGYKEDVTFYNVESLKKFLNSITKESPLEKIISRYPKITTREEKLIKFLSQDRTCDELHFIKKIPIYILHKGVLHEGGRLKDYDFSKVIDPYTCFQEINMYVSGKLGGQSPELIEVSDKVKIESKGFDNVTSFRNMKRGGYEKQKS